MQNHASSSQNALISCLGQVSDLKGHFVTQVAMGKAHTCVLTKSGEVWTFGVNNKGQCGRDTGSMTQAGKGKKWVLHVVKVKCWELCLQAAILTLNKPTVAPKAFNWLPT